MSSKQHSEFDNIQPCSNQPAADDDGEDNDKADDDNDPKITRRRMCERLLCQGASVKGKEPRALYREAGGGEAAAEVELPVAVPYYKV